MKKKKKEKKNREGREEKKKKNERPETICLTAIVLFTFMLIQSLHCVKVFTPSEPCTDQSPCTIRQLLEVVFVPAASRLTDILTTKTYAPIDTRA